MKSRIMEIFGVMLAIRTAIEAEGINETNQVLATTLEKGIEGIIATSREEEIVVNGRKFLSVRLAIPEDALLRLEEAFKTEGLL